MATHFSSVIGYESKFVKIKFLVKSILLWQRCTKNFEIDKIRILRDLDCYWKSDTRNFKWGVYDYDFCFLINIQWHF